MIRRFLCAAAFLTAAILALNPRAGAAQSPIATGVVLHYDAQNLNNTAIPSNPAAGAITEWSDRSGNNFHLNNGNGGVYNVGSAAINGQNFVHFSTTGYLRTAVGGPEIPATTFATGGNQHSSFYVLDFNSGVVFSQWSQGNNAANRYGWEGTGRWDFNNDSTGKLEGWSTSLSSNFQILSGLSAPGANNKQVFINGALVATGTTPGSITGLSRYALGATVDGGAGADVDFAEVLHFNRKLNLAEQRIVENYLSSKYNLPVANDYYAGDTLSAGDYDFGVIGVGQVNASNFSTTTASVDGLAITATGGLDDGEFVMAGHASGANAIVSAIGDNISAGERWSREWFIDTNGSSVDLQLVFDYVGDGFASTDASDEYSLLYRVSGATDYTILASAGLPSGNSVLFNINSSELAGGYITLGINAEAQVVPEPATVALWTLLASCAAIAVGLRRRDKCMGHA